VHLRDERHRHGAMEPRPEENNECPDGGSYAHNVVIHYASWSPNGRRIAFRGDGVCTSDGFTTGGLNIWTMNPAGVLRGTSQQTKT
jgi:hypothetical protein